MMIQFLFTLAQLIFSTNQTFLMEETEVGCKIADQSPCTELCILGVEDCSTAIPICEYGYFLFTQSNPQTCVQCPYQGTNDVLTMYCMDCVENPYKWNFNRKCTYDYYIGNGDPNYGSYQLIKKSFSELYFVGTMQDILTWSGTITRSRAVLYQTFVCSGCESFCTLDDITCSEITNSYSTIDTDKVGITCLLGYYFWQDLCRSCSVKNCMSCNNDKCITCQIGYATDNIGSSCTSCPNNCNTCHYEGTQLWCDECSSTDDEAYVVSLDRLLCEPCGTNCKRCEYLTYVVTELQTYPSRAKTQIIANQNNFMKRCQQCSYGSQGINLYGIFCEDCQIYDCETCYYIIRTVDGQPVTTIDMDFEPLKSGEIESQQLCLKCKNGFFLSLDKLSCTAIASLPVASNIANCKIYKQTSATQFKCWECVEGFILDQNTGTCFGACSNYIQNCKYCFSYNSLDIHQIIDSSGTATNQAAQKLFQCYLCNDGYYPNFFTGECVACQSNCQECWQYTLSHNFTQYLSLQVVLTDTQKSAYQTFTLQNPYCSKCLSGYISIDNECKGCTSNCVISSPTRVETDPSSILQSVCTYTDSSVFCGQCYNSFRDRSLTSDMSECHECPLNCVACRDRTTEENNQINPYFNPTSLSLQKYGKLCYKYQTNSIATEAIDYLSYLNLPISCSYSAGKTKKCKRKTSTSVSIFCDDIEYQNAFVSATPEAQKYMFSLGKFYSKNNGNTATISFDDLETLTTYDEMNKQVIEEMEFTINFIKQTANDDSFDGISRKECKLRKTTIISVNFQKNVFSLRKFTLIISGSDDATDLMRLYLDGYIQIPAQNRIIFKGFDINYKPQSSSNAYFGLQINQNDKTELILQDCKFGRFNKTVYSEKLIMNLNNVKTLSMLNTEYYNLKTTDVFNIAYTVSQIDTLTYNFNKVTFTKMELYNTILFKLDKISLPEIFINIGDEGMILDQCIFNKSEIFGEAADNQAQTGQITLNKVVIKYSYFNNSYFLNLKTTNLTIINNLDVISSDFYQSILIISNSFEILNSYIYSNTFRNSSRAFRNPDKIIDNLDISNSIQQYSFTNMKFISNDCQNTQCFIYLTTPANNYGYMTNITFQNITIQQTSSFLISEKESYSVKSSLFYLTNVGKIIIMGLQSDNNLGITILSAINIQSLRLDGGLYDWSQNSYGIQPDDVTNTTDTPGAKILLPSNNKIPASQLCASRKVEYKSFSQLYLFISQFLYGVSISNVVVRRQLSIDTIFIKILSWDIEHTNTTSETIFNQMEFYDGYFKEQIYLKNIRFIGNSLTVTQASSNAASIQIESSQLQIVVIDQMQFTDNHLHSLVPNVIEQSATTLLINSPIATVNITNSIFNKNRATRISSGILQIICSELNMVSNQFNNTNIMDLEWIYRIEEFQFNTDTSEDIISNMDSFFKVLTVGGNANVKAEYITITLNTFDKGYAIKGAGLYFETIDLGEVTIQDSYFANQFNTLENQYVSNGGCLYIDSLNSKLSLKLSNVVMQNCVTRRSGGCIYIDSSTLSHDVIILDSQFKNCQALLQSVLQANFPTTSTIEPEIQIDRSIFFGNNMINFIRNIPDVLSSEIDYLTSESTAIGQNYGYLSISNSEFQDFNYTSVLKLMNMIQISFNDVTLKNNAIFIQQLIYIKLQGDFGTVQISKSSFQNNNQYFTLTSDQFDLTFGDGYVSYLKNYTTATLEIQSCGMLFYLDTLFRLLNAQAAALITSLYSSNVETTYNLMSSLQKYEYPYINVDQLVSYTSLEKLDPSTTFFVYQNFENNSLMTKAILSYIVINYAESTFPTALFHVSSLSSTQMVNISSLDIESNECIRCYGGLLQIFSVIETDTPTIYLEDINCQQNLIGYYGCISISNESKMTNVTLVLPITDYPIINTSARILSVTSDLVALKHQLRLDQSNFFKNRAKIGAGISIVGMNALITLTDFSDNEASLIGGSILFKSLNQNSLLLFGNTLQGNSAQLAGGIFIYGGSLPNETSVETYFSNNVGTLKGSNLEEYPQKLSIRMKNENTKFGVKTFLNYSGDADGDGYIDSTSVNIIDIVDIQNYTIPNYQGETNYLILPSGQKISTYKYYYSYTEEQVPFEWIFRILNLDRYQQPMSNIDKTNQCKITGRIMDTNNFNDSTTYLSNFTSPTYVYFDDSVGEYNLDNLIIYFDPKLAQNYYLQLKCNYYYYYQLVVCSSISIPVYMTTSPYTTIGYNTNYALLLNIRTFPCQLGEAYSQMQCLACSQTEQTYAVDLNQLQCNSINSATMDQTTPVAIKLKATYWRAEYDLEQIEYCTNLPSNCNGGWKPGNPSCYTGHMGGLCESCDIYSTRTDQSYSISSKYTCGQCADTVALNSIVITALSIVTLVSMALSVKGNYQMLEDFVRNLRLMSMGILISQSGSNLAILIKLFTNYFQIISSLTTFQLSLPSSLTSTVTVVGNPTQSMSYSLDCFLVGLTTIDILYFRMIWALVMPIAYLAIFFFAYFLAVALNKLPYKTGVIYTTFIYMFIYLQPTLVGGFISLASSRHAGGINWVQADVLYKYDSNTHTYWMLVFVLPLLLAWAVVFPCIFMYLVYRIKEELNDVNNRRKLGYFYNEYTQEGYLWEFVKIFEKELIIIVLTYYEDRIVVKGLIIFLIVFVYGVFTIKFHPYSSKRLNIIDRVSTAICAVSLCLGVLIYAAQKEELNYITYIMFIIVGILNIGFILLMIFYLFEGYLIKFQDILDKIRDRVRIKYPELQEYPLIRKALINREKLGSKVKVYWALLRYNVRQGIKRRREDPNQPLFKQSDIEKVVIKPYGFSPGVQMNGILAQLNIKAKTIGNETPMNKLGARVYPENQDSPVEFNQIE